MAGSDMIKINTATEESVPVFKDRVKSSAVTMRVVVTAITPSVNLEQIYPATINMAADMISTAA
ncbi:hypothetical protein cym2001_27780 [Pseudomonas sp. CYM-20-01]|nr:hypothetical protein cym2001_27780 [Pseudomonas sp. CYM-20-01]